MTADDDGQIPHELREQLRDELDRLPALKGREPQPGPKANGEGRHIHPDDQAVILKPAEPYTWAAAFLEHCHGHRDGRTLQRHRGSFYVYAGTH